MRALTDRCLQTPGCARPFHLPQAMEGLVREGLVRTIGTSNFGAKKLADILSYAQIPPAVCQVGGVWLTCVAGDCPAGVEMSIACLPHSPVPAGGGAPLPPQRAAAGLLRTEQHPRHGLCTAWISRLRLHLPPQEAAGADGGRHSQGKCWIRYATCCWLLAVWVDVAPLCVPYLPAATTLPSLYCHWRPCCCSAATIISAPAAPCCTGCGGAQRQERGPGAGALGAAARHIGHPQVNLPRPHPVSCW